MSERTLSADTVALDSATLGATDVFRLTQSGVAKKTVLSAIKTFMGIGTTTNDDAAAGSVGELIESEVLVGSAVSLTSPNASNVTSISLTAGDWDVWGNVTFTINSATVINLVQGAIHTVSATIPTRPNKGAQALVWFGSALAGPTIQQLALGQKRISVASTTTVYLVAASNFTTNTCAVYGYIGARRVR